MPWITIEIPDDWASNLEVLVDREVHHSVGDVLVELADHAQQGVYRPGSWERPWLQQAFGYDWLANVEPDDRPSRTSLGGEIIFDRPRARWGS